MATRRRSARFSRGSDAVLSARQSLDELEVKVVELANREDFAKLKIIKDEYFRVQASEDITKCEPGDVIVRVHGIELLDMSGGVPELEVLIDSMKTWPIQLELRVGLSLPSQRLQPTPPPLPTHVPQIPTHKMMPSLLLRERGTISIASAQSGEIDLTLIDSDEEDELGEILVDQKDDSRIVKSPDQGATWFRGQIVRTRFGVGSVCESTANRLVVMLHWASKAVAYLNPVEEPVTDCSQEISFKKDGFVLSRADFARFQPGMYLNDTIIDLFLTQLVNQKISSTLRERCHVFTSHFYSQLERGKFTDLARWTKGVDIFSKDFVFIPVNESNHWSLVILCFPGRVVDLLKGKNSESIMHVSDDDEETGFTHKKQPELETTLGTCDQETVPIPDVSQERQSIVDTLGGDASRMENAVSVASIEEENIKSSAFQEVLNCNESLKRAREVLEDKEDFHAEVDDAPRQTRPRRKSTNGTAPTLSKGILSQTAQTATVQDEPLTDEAIGRTGKGKRAKMSYLEELIMNSSQKERPDDHVLVPVILKLDSTKSHESRVLAKNLRQWVRDELVRRKKDILPNAESLVVATKVLPIVAPVAPVQNNTCDCGVFVLAFADAFLRDRQNSELIVTSSVVRKRFPKIFGSYWFALDEIESKRKEMAHYILENGNVRL